MTRIKTAGLMAASALFAIASPAAAQNLVTNGSFESGFAGWTIGMAGGGTAPVVIDYGQNSGYPTGAFGEAVPVSNATSLSPDAAGQRFAYFSSDTASPHTLTQAINLVAGTLYNVGFDYYVPLNGFNNPFDATLSLIVDGVTVSSLTAGQASGTTPQTWFNFNQGFTASTTGAASLVFSFQGLGSTAADFGVDRVYATAAVPEASTWAMMIAGFGALGFAMRSRKAAKPRIRFA